MNYKRRQSFFAGHLDWNTDEFYEAYKGHIGSATAQQIIRKNSEAWRSFFALVRRWRQERGQISAQRKLTTRLRPPGYWKARVGAPLVWRILVRSDSYQLTPRRLHLPFGLKLRWSGHIKWEGKPGRLEIHYDALKKRWEAHMPVEVREDLRHQPHGTKRAYLDLGVRVLLMVWIEGHSEVFGYAGQPLLTDWWYWTHQIAAYQAQLKQQNGRETSHHIRQLYRHRQRRFQHVINTLVHRVVHACWTHGVGELVAGDLTGIRATAYFHRKSNALVHNFWSHGYLVQRLQAKAAEYGLRLTFIDERGTSSTCPRCGSRHITCRKRWFHCRECGLEAHRDAMGAVNIGRTHAGT